MLSSHFMRINFYTFCKIKSETHLRQLVISHPLTFSKFDQYILHTTVNSYQFLKKNETKEKQLMVHKGNTPASILMKDCLHVFEEGMDPKNMKQSFKAFTRQLKQRYKKSFEKITNGAEIYHLERRIKSDMRRYQNRVGVLHGRHKHYPIWIPYKEYLGIMTLQNYEKKGVKVDILNASLFQKGKIWMPTRQNYLNLLQSYINSNSHQLNVIKTVADIGVGSGVLSFYLAQRFKKYQKIIGFDINPDAVETSKLNSVKLNIKNFQAYQLDITKKQNYSFLQKKEKLPKFYDLIICNPPWIVAKMIMSTQHGFEEGVYDQKQQVLKSSLQFTKTHLNKGGKLLLIYSTLSYEIGLTKTTVESLCEAYKLKINSQLQIPYIQSIESGDNLHMFKQKSKIVLYEITHS